METRDEAEAQKNNEKENQKTAAGMILSPQFSQREKKFV